MIVKKNNKWYVYSENGKMKLGGPYDTKAEAQERLKEIEYYANRDASIWRGILKNGF